MTKNNKIIAGVVAVVLLGGAFYGGDVYGRSSASAKSTFAGGTGFARGGAGTTGARGAGGGLVTGQIISAASGSVTVKLANGNTQIILLGDSTQIMKTAVGSASDLSAGTNVVVTGTTNSDGSLTAQSVQIRPAGSSSFGGRPATTTTQ